MANQNSQLALHIDTGQETNVEEMAKLSRRLREELLELDVEKVDLARVSEPPAKSKTGDPVTWGTILVTMAASGGVLTTLITTVRSWLMRNERHKITMEINGDKLDVTGISSKEQQRLIESWLRRHQGV